MLFIMSHSGKFQSHEIRCVIPSFLYVFSETSISHFVETKLGMLVGLIDLYKDLYQSVKASGREHLEHMWVKQFRDEEMQDAVNNLLDFEVNDMCICQCR